MAYPEMGINACMTRPSLNAEITMFPRLAGVLANLGRALARLRSGAPRETNETGQALVAPHQVVARPVQRGDNPPRASRAKQESAEFIRTQNQLMEAMLKSMILASGGNVDDSPRRDGLRPNR
jgi:hypothetical protein